LLALAALRAGPFQLRARRGQFRVALFGHERPPAAIAAQAARVDFQRALDVLQKRAVMADEQQAAPGLAPCAHLVEEERAVAKVEVVARFVQHEQVGVRAKGADQREQRVLAAGQGLWFVPRIETGAGEHRFPTGLQVPAVADDVEVLGARIACRKAPQGGQRRVEPGDFGQGARGRGPGLLFDVADAARTFDAARGGFEPAREHAPEWPIRPTVSAPNDSCRLVKRMRPSGRMMSTPCRAAK
jgi:hypothetical protein